MSFMSQQRNPEGDDTRYSPTTNDGQGYVKASHWFSNFLPTATVKFAHFTKSDTKTADMSLRKTVIDLTVTFDVPYPWMFDGKKLEPNTIIRNRFTSVTIKEFDFVSCY